MTTEKSMQTARRLGIFGAVAMAIAGIVGGIDSIGGELRLIHVLGLFIAGFGSGASLVVALHPPKKE